VKFHVTHTTRYRYAESIPLSHNVVRLRPRNHSGQVCMRHELIVSPAPAVEIDGLDYFGNHVAWFSLQEPHTELRIASRSEIYISPAPCPDLAQGPSWEQVRDVLLAPPDPATITARQFCFASPHVPLCPEFADYAKQSFEPGRPLLQCVSDLTERIYEDFKFLPGSTGVGTPVTEVLGTRQGVCQDFAQLQIACLRSLGLAGRYISGYIVTNPPPGQERLIGADASHAWVSVFSPENGWVDFDPTNGLMPSDSHITVAWGRDYNDVAPANGILIGGKRHRLDVSVDVVPVEAGVV
jgi:transglutaminase-like putative cysteine protease